MLSCYFLLQLAAVLPARVEGHVWRLVFNNEEHGFSLSTFYRNMYEYDGATILLIQDDSDGVSGKNLCSFV